MTIVEISDSASLRCGLRARGLEALVLRVVVLPALLLVVPLPAALLRVLPPCRAGDLSRGRVVGFDLSLCSARGDKRRSESLLISCCFCCSVRRTTPSWPGSGNCTRQTAGWQELWEAQPHLKHSCLCRSLIFGLPISHEGPRFKTWCNSTTIGLSTALSHQI